MKKQQLYPQTIGSQVVSVTNPVKTETKDDLEQVLSDIVEYSGEKETMPEDYTSGIDLGGIISGQDLSELTPGAVLVNLLTPVYAPYIVSTGKLSFSNTQLVYLVGSDFYIPTTSSTSAEIKCGQSYKTVRTWDQMSASTIICKDSSGSTISDYPTTVNAAEIYNFFGSVTFTCDLVGSQLTATNGKETTKLATQANVLLSKAGTQSTDLVTDGVCNASVSRTTNYLYVKYVYPDFIVNTTDESNLNLYSYSGTSYTTEVIPEDDLKYEIAVEYTNSKSTDCAIEYNDVTKAYDAHHVVYKEDRNYYYSTTKKKWIPQDTDMPFGAPQHTYCIYTRDKACGESIKIQLNK